MNRYQLDQHLYRERFFLYISTMNHAVKISRARDGVAVIKLNRPERLNAVSFALVDDQHEALGQLDKDPSCHVIVLTGEGRGFCSGIDLKAIGDPGQATVTTATDAQRVRPRTPGCSRRSTSPPSYLASAQRSSR